MTNESTIYFIQHSGTTTVTHSISGDSTLDDVLEAVQQFLRGCGFCIEYNKVLDLLDMDNE